jgi:hypothetical protein
MNYLVSLDPNRLQRRLLERKRVVNFPRLKVILGNHSCTMDNPEWLQCFAGLNLFSHPFPSVATLDIDIGYI